jgi:hypothetical protein
MPRTATSRALGALQIITSFVGRRATSLFNCSHPMTFPICASCVMCPDTFCYRCSMLFSHPQRPLTLYVRKHYLWRLATHNRTRQQLPSQFALLQPCPLLSHPHILSCITSKTQSHSRKIRSLPQTKHGAAGQRACAVHDNLLSNSSSIPRCRKQKELATQRNQLQRRAGLPLRHFTSSAGSILLALLAETRNRRYQRASGCRVEGILLGERDIGAVWAVRGVQGAEEGGSGGRGGDAGAVKKVDM